MLEKGRILLTTEKVTFQAKETKLPKHRLFPMCVGRQKLRI